jgi:hypothetical protein
VTEDIFSRYEPCERCVRKPALCGYVSTSESDLTSLAGKVDLVMRMHRDDSVSHWSQACTWKDSGLLEHRAVLSRYFGVLQLAGPLSGSSRWRVTMVFVEACNPYRSRSSVVDSMVSWLHACSLYGFLGDGQLAGRQFHDERLLVSRQGWLGVQMYCCTSQAWDACFCLQCVH